MRDMFGIILAYSTQAKVKELGDLRAAPSLPFGGRYRVIDFMLSSMVNAGITNVGVIMRENYQSLLDHLGSGKDWDLNRKRGGLRLLPPFGYAQSRVGEIYRGKMEALSAVSTFVQRIRQKYVAIADGDLIANFPIDDIYDSHIESGADITAVCTQKRIRHENATFFTLGTGGMVADIAADIPQTGGYESLDFYIMEKQLLLKLISHSTAYNLYDFERNVLQKMLGALSVHGYVFDGFTARLDSAASYFKHSMELLQPDVRSELFNARRPIKTKVRDESSTYYGQESVVKNCVVADGCYIEGEVTNSILFRGVRVHKGARINNCVLMQDTRVKENASLTYAITDKEVLINQGRMLMGHETYPIAIAKGVVV